MRSRRVNRPDAGMVTAELAVCLPVLLLLVAAALGLIEAGSAQVRALDAAREAARAAARGDPAEAQALGRAEAPGARIVVSATGSDVTATAVLQVHLLGDLLPTVTVSQSAVAALEPATSTPAP